MLPYALVLVVFSIPVAFIDDSQRHDSISNRLYHNLFVISELAAIGLIALVRQDHDIVQLFSIIAWALANAAATVFPRALENAISLRRAVIISCGLVGVSVFGFRTLAAFACALLFVSFLATFLRLSGRISQIGFVSALLTIWLSSLPAVWAHHLACLTTCWAAVLGIIAVGTIRAVGKTKE
jgi:hypothetical protein